MTAPKNDKSAKMKPTAPRGFADRDAADIAVTHRMMEKIRTVYERYGFEAVETPFVEYTEALGKFLPDQDRPNEGVFSFQDDDEQWLSLRYDLTAPLARYVAENFDRLPKPYRSYRAGWVFRNEKPGPGRFRQFMQFDADTVGASSVAADAEVCMMAADTMEALGIKRGDYVIKVNNRKILDGVMEAIGVREDQKLTVMRAIDKADKFPRSEIEKLLGAGRWDGGEQGKGDFTKGAGLDPDQIEVVLAMTSPLAAHNADPDEAELQRREKLTGDERGELFAWGLPLYPKYDVLKNANFISGSEELAQIQKLCIQSGYKSNRIRIDPSVVRGLEYYTGPVFECELTFEVKGEDGKPVRFGSVGGGGRYDGLVSRFRPEPVPATGFSIGVSRLAAALKAINSPIVANANAMGPVVVLVMDKTEIGSYQKMVTELRNANIRAEMYLGESNKLGPQFKYAEKRNSPCVIIQGSEERKSGQVTIKDFIEGAKQKSAAKTNEEYRSMRAAQFSCPENEMVARVKEILAAHGG